MHLNSPFRCPSFSVPILDELWVVSEFRLEIREATTQYEDFVWYVFTFGLQETSCLGVYLRSTISHNEGSKIQGQRTLAAFGPLKARRERVSKDPNNACHTHRTWESAQWKTTMGTSFVRFTSSSTLSRKPYEGELCDPLIFPPCQSSSRTSITQ